MSLRIHNTLTRSIEEFHPIDPAGKTVTFYNCGPTVYGPFHLGNARNYVAADVLRRWLERLGHTVRFIQNITDIDDKIIARAQKENRSCPEVAEEFTRLFFEHAGRLGVRRADVHPKATEFIPQMLEMIQHLIEKGYAYASADGSVWFRVSAFGGYGRLSGKPLEDLREGERVASEQQSLKENPSDFALWKASKPGEPAWKSPWGQGRPGWHIECSCMSTALLGETIDFHMGGVDLVFPHHENERAQSECATGKPFVRYWVHNGFLNVRDDKTGEETKMSKSLGNFFRIDEALEKFDALTIRHFLISAQYRSPLTFSEDNLNASRAAMRRILEALRRAERTLGPPAAAPGSIEKSQALIEAALAAAPAAAQEKYKSLRADFAAAMNDDLNTPVALASVFGAAQELNRALDEPQSPAAAELFRSLLLFDFLDVLGLDPALARKAEESSDQLVPALLDLLIEVRAEARKRKAFDLADKIRNGLAGSGILLEDTPKGTIWKRQEG